MNFVSTTNLFSLCPNLLILNTYVYKIVCGYYFVCVCGCVCVCVCLYYISMGRICEYNESAQCLTKWTEEDTKLLEE